MTPYTAYNLGLALLILPLSYWLGRRSDRRRNFFLSARIASLVSLIGFPWDFFAIQVGVWRYPSDPGLKIHGVPVNDLVFMWLCTYLACSLLVALNGRQPRSQGHSESKDAGEQDARDNRTGSS
jgi:lycopene cyclase domain-containing protein